MCLLQEELFSVQVRIRTWDTAYPDNYIERVLTIDVNRNVFGPVFNGASFTLQDDFPSGNVVYNLTASDGDNVSCWCFPFTQENGT